MGHRQENDSEESRAADTGEFGRAYADALLAGDQVAAEIAIRESMDARLSRGQIDDEIITPALWLVGELWEKGELSVADEHLATEITLRVLALQREAQRTSRERGGHRVVLAAPRGELHVVALRMADNLLRDAGYEVAMLGADVPTDALAAFASRHKPGAVCLSATMPVRVDEVLGLARIVHTQWPAAAFVVGGAGFTTRIPPGAGIEVCRRVTEVVEAVDAVVKHARLN